MDTVRDTLAKHIKDFKRWEKLKNLTEKKIVSMETRICFEGEHETDYNIIMCVTQIEE